MKTINLEEKASKIAEHWHPYIVGELNENYVKLAKLKGELVWHSHEQEDEMFVVMRGTLMMDFRDGSTTETRVGEILIVPKGVEHRPWTKDEEVLVMLIEPKSTKHTGEVKVAQTVGVLEWI
jgi:mannose-6-phosphate isomerase-like protein (cupin superfamily)